MIKKNNCYGPVPHSRADCNSHEVAGAITSKELTKENIKDLQVQNTTAEGNPYIQKEKGRCLQDHLVKFIFGSTWIHGKSSLECNEHTPKENNNPAWVTFISGSTF